jgi:hypothetical protein
VKSINCTGFSKKKKTVHFSEQCDSGAWLHCSLENHHEKQQNAASPNLWHGSENWWVLSRKITFFSITKH